MAMYSDLTIQEMIDEKRRHINALAQSIELIQPFVSAPNPDYDDLRTAYKALCAARVSLQLAFDMDKHVVDYYDAHPISQSFGLADREN